MNLSVCLHWRILFELARGAVPCCARVSCSVEVATVAARCSYSCSNLLVVNSLCVCVCVRVCVCVCVLVGVATDTLHTPNLAHGFLMGCDTFLRCASIH